MGLRHTRETQSLSVDEDSAPIQGSTEGTKKLVVTTRVLAEVRECMDAGGRIDNLRQSD